MAVRPIPHGRVRTHRRSSGVQALPRLVGPWRGEPRLVLLVLLVGVATFMVASIPGFVGNVSDDGIRAAVAAASPAQTGISVSVDGRIQAATEEHIFDALTERGEAYHAELPPTLRTVTDAPGWVMESPPFQLVDQQGLPLYANLFQYHAVRVRYQQELGQGADTHVRVVAGRVPQQREPLSLADVSGEGRSVDTDARDNALRPTFEVALTAATLTALNAELGDRVLALPSAGGSLPAGSMDARPRDLSVILEIVGVIEVLDPQAPYWFGDPSLAQPGVNQSGEQVYIAATVLAAADAAVYADLLAATQVSSSQALDWRYRWQMATDASRLSSGTADALLTDLRTLAATRGPLGLLIEDAAVSQVQTDLPTIVADYASQRRMLLQTLSIAAVALVVLAVVLVGLVAALLTERRRRMLVLLRARGAAPGDLLLARALEALLLCVPVGIGAWLVSQLVFAQHRLWPSLPLAIVVVVAAVLACVLVSLPLSLRPLGVVQREQVQTRPTQLAAGQLVVDALLIVLAVGGVLLLRRRGLVTDAASGAPAVDPYLAAVPLLVAAACGALVLRVVPLFAQHLARLAQRRRGLTSFLALRRVAEMPPVLGLATAVILIAAAIATLGVVVHTSISDAQQARAWQVAGAAYRIDLKQQAPETAILALAALPGVDAVAAAAVQPGVTLSGGDDAAAASVSIVALDPEAYQQVIDGTPLGDGERAPLHQIADGGSDGGPAALLPRSLMEQFRAGDQIYLGWGDGIRAVKVAGFHDGVPGIEANTAVVIVAPQVLQDLLAGQSATAQHSVVLLAGETIREANLQTWLTEHDSSGSLTSARALLQTAQTAPLARGVRLGFWGTALAATVLAASTCLAAIVMSSPARTRQLAFLGTLGLPRRSLPLILLIELLPLLLLACALGVGVGIGIVYLIEPVLPFNAFLPAALLPSSGDSEPALRLSWTLVTVPVTILAACMAMIAIHVLTASRRGALRALRLGDA